MDPNFCSQNKKYLVSYIFFFLLFCLLAALSRCAVLYSKSIYIVTFTLSSLGDFFSKSLFIVLSQITKSSCVKKPVQLFISFQIYTVQSTANLQYFGFFCCLSSHHSHSPSLILNVPLLMTLPLPIPPHLGVGRWTWAHT